MGIAVVAPQTAGARGAVAVCAPGGPPVTFAGTVQPADAKTYEALPFDVASGTTRVEVTYEWVDLSPLPPTPITQTVLDLGLWDTGGLGAAEGFRGWSGSRAGRRSSQPAVFVQQDVAQRGYQPAPIDPGTWWVDLGIATVGPLGATWDVAVTCTDPAVGPAFVPAPVDPTHVARAEPGWYRGDFHMHGYHSNLRAPSWADMVAEARAVGLDFLPITDYVTGQHWDELGPVQAANPDILIVPGREIITYFGHLNAIGETRSVLDYRHGYPGVSLAAIQDLTRADGALFQVNHPTFFPGPLFANFCRGCEFTLGSVIDWDEVDTFEVLTGPALVTSADIGAPDLPVQIESPFMLTALDQWQRLLREGHRITAVSGSDSKGVEPDARRRWGTNATAVYATELSRPAVFAAVRAGHAYVQTRGALHSPALELTAVAADGTTAMMGDTLAAATATMTATITGGMGQVLLVTRDGLPSGLPVPITSDPFTYTWTADRAASPGPLGTFWRIDTRDLQSYTTISNPIFLADPVPAAPAVPPAPAVPGAGSGAGAGAGADALPATGPSPPWALAAAGLLVFAYGARRVMRRA
jgi:hypothetical protein